MALSLQPSVSISKSFCSEICLQAQREYKGTRLSALVQYIFYETYMSVTVVVLTD